MSSFNGPGVVSRGLIFAYDMSNDSKSFIGAPTTNLAAFPATGYNWINSGNATYTDNDTTEQLPEVPNNRYFSTPLKVVSCQTTTASSQGQQCGYAITSVSGSTQYTMSLWFKKNRDDMGSYGPYVRQSVNNNWHGTFDYNGETNNTLWPTNKWIRIKSTFTTSSNETGVYLSNYIGAYVGDKVCYAGGQLEQKGFASPLAEGSRSNTQALIDATGRSVITAANMQYNSDGTFDYVYSSPSYVEVPLSTAFNKLEGSINVWIYPTRYNGGNGIFVNRTDSTPNAGDWLWIGPYSNYFYFRLGDGSSCCSNDNSFSNYSTVVPLNTWTNLCCTWSSGGTSVIYINGVLYQSRAISSIPSTSPSSYGRFGLGHANADDYYNGRMPVAHIYNRQLTSSEVNANFNAMRRRYGI